MDKGRQIIVTFMMFLIGGLLFLVGGLFFGLKDINRNQGCKTTGVITDIYEMTQSNGSTDKYTEVAYEVHGEQYVSTLYSCRITYRVGKEITIYYNEKYPTLIETGSPDITVFAIPALGLILVCVGFAGLLLPVLRKRMERKLKESGELVHATYVDTDLNLMLSVNGVHPYNVVCRWTDPWNGTEYEFRSKDLWQDPTHIIKGRNITAFPVYIDPKNRKKYVVDLEKISSDLGES